jgi:hypothetical protein
MKGRGPGGRVFPPNPRDPEYGEVPERPNGPRLHRGEGFAPFRGFESHSLRWTRKGRRLHRRPSLALRFLRMLSGSPRGPGDS